MSKLQELRLLLSFILSLPLFWANAQEKYWVFFSDKNGVEFNPFEYFDAKAIDRREKLGLSLNHYSDRPVRSDYLTKITAAVDSVTYPSRWFNAVAVYAFPSQVDLISKFPFVTSVEKMEGEMILLEDDEDESDIHQGEINLAKAQLDRMGVEAFRKDSLFGKGVRVCVIDAGFPGVQTADMFHYLRKEDRIKGTYDFTKRSKNCYGGLEHGTQVLSNIVGLTEDSVQFGMAIQAEVLLARTEKIFKEGISEEELWVAAVEWADKKGADIINSSLGYTKSLYFRDDMDGKTALISRAANMAARKGILVVIANGNEGTDPNWRRVTAPADADSALAVGAINPWTNLHYSFSSYGPSADGRLKPNVSAYGAAMVEGKREKSVNMGTSFASPLVAGFAACLWQSNPNWTNMELFDKIENSTDLYPYFDYAHGYGVPNAYFALENTIKIDTTFDTLRTEFGLEVHIRDDFFAPTQIIIDNYYTKNTNMDDYIINAWSDEGKKKPFFHLNDRNFNTPSSKVNSAFFPYFFVHVEEEGVLEKYFTLTVEDQKIIDWKFLDEFKGKTVRMHYRGYTLKLEL